MASRRLNPNLLKVHRSYTAGELASRLGVHKNTIRNWQRDGLAALDDSRPVLFQGATVREFLRARNRGASSPAGRGASIASAAGRLRYRPRAWWTSCL